MSTGTETSTKLISQGLLMFERNPELPDRVADDLDLLPGVIEEILRFEAPIQGMCGQAETTVTDGEVHESQTTVELQPEEIAHGGGAWVRVGEERVERREDPGLVVEVRTHLTSNPASTGSVTPVR
jgi:hypothetical protein